MKTLILNGSPRENGDTAFLTELLHKSLTGEILTVNAYRAAIAPCTDCRFCWEHAGCSIRDGMQEVYAAIEESDGIVIASPIYFSELTGPLLSVASRLQLFYASRHFRGTELLPKRKIGAVILCGGGSGGAKQAEQTAQTLLRCMNADPLCTVLSLHTDSVPASQDASALTGIRELAGVFNRRGITENEESFQLE